MWLGVIILHSPGKGAPWKFWLDPRFPRNSKPKWTLKWLPIDRGYFKFYFYKGESLLIISCRTYLSTRKCVILFQVIFCITMHFVLVKMSRNSVLSIDDPSKKGDVETLAWSSVSRHPKWKWSLNWLPLDRGHLKLISYERALSIK